MRGKGEFKNPPTEKKNFYSTTGDVLCEDLLYYRLNLYITSYPCIDTYRVGFRVAQMLHFFYVDDTF